MCVVASVEAREVVCVCSSLLVPFVRVSSCDVCRCLLRGCEYVVALRVNVFVQG